MTQKNQKTQKFHNAIFAGIFIVIILNTVNHVHAWSTNPPPNNSGGPTDYMCTNCHLGSDAIYVSTGILTNIPPEGYTPGETYTITVGGDLINTGFGAYGFELSAQDILGDHVGTLVGNDSVSGFGGRSQYIGNSTIISSPTTWTLDWVAPPAGTGSFSFYAASVNGDGDGTALNDKTYKTSLFINEATPTGLNNLKELKKLNVVVTQNKELNVILNANQGGTYSLTVISINGQSILQKNIEVTKGENSFTTAFNNGIEKAIYIVRLSNDSNTYQTEISI